jgi:hypothetical protein
VKRFFQSGWNNLFQSSKETLRFLIVTSLMTPCALAILDTNNNGLSDFWERDFNNGSLFNSSFDPQADPDKDGWPNELEAAAGTNPFDPNPPDGLIRPDIIHTPAVWGEENGVPYIDTPEAVTVTWPTISGKRYRLLVSPDLSQGSWIGVPNSDFIGNGNAAEFNFTTAESDNLFWRVAVEDVDTDGDGLSDHEEHLFGTEAWNPETFGGIPDAWLALHYTTVIGFDPYDDDDNDELSNFEEYLNGSNPNDDDTDDDGTPDADEVNQGGNPNDASDGGAAPADLLEDVAFTVGGDYAYWRMEIHAKGPRDQRILRLVSPSPGYPATRSFKLHRNNHYEITLHRTGGEEDWYCWEAAVDSKPETNTFDEGDGWISEGIRNDQSHFFTVAGHWLVDNRQGLLTSHLHSLGMDVASPLKVELVPVAIEDNIEATGVDIVSNSVAPDVPGYRDKLWIMAPIAGPPPPADYSNEMKFHIPLNPEAALDMESDHATPDPATITLDNGKPAVLWRGSGVNETNENTTIFKIGEHDDEVDLPIGVKTMKYRKVKILIHYVTGAKKDPGTGEFINLKPPVTQITAQQIKDKLYEIYSRQINAWFGNLETVSHIIDWDIGVSADWGTPDHPIQGTQIESFNQVLDMGDNVDDANQPSPRPEESKLLGLGAQRPDADIHVILLGGCFTIQKHIGFVGGLLPVDTMQGRADRDQKLVYLATQTATGQALPQQEMLFAIAHEIGHVIIGPGHPDQGDGSAPLPGTALVERLMFSVIDSKVASGALDKNLLVKGEWDAADEWLVGNVDPVEE